MNKQPLAIDLFCGLGGWTEGLLAENWRVVGFDIKRHQYGDEKYPAQLVIQDVLTLHGRQFRDAALIVASPPCQEFSYMAMPWSLAKAKRAAILADPAERKRLTALFDACFRIQREAIEAAGHFIPLVVENVHGANEWVGRSRWNFGSYHLWGDVPALMPMTKSISSRVVPAKVVSDPSIKVPGQDWNNYKKYGEVSPEWTMQLTKNSGGSWFAIGLPGQKELGRNPVHDPEAFGWKVPRTSSHSNARKAASAAIAKIPFALASYIARTWKPQPS